MDNGTEHGTAWYYGGVRHPETEGSWVSSDAMEALAAVCDDLGVDEWGVAANPGDWPLAPELPFAVSLVMRHAPQAMVGLETEEMSQAFFDDFSRLFAQLDRAADAVMALVRERGHQVLQINNVMAGPNDVPDIADWGDAGVFAHKTAATQADLGWIGKTACFVSERFGQGVRLTTVFTDMPLEPGVPVIESRCGNCRLCVDACPVGAGRDVLWTAGMPRDDLYDEKACEAQTDKHPEWDGTCGVCQSVCPHTKKVADVAPRALRG